MNQYSLPQPALEESQEWKIHHHLSFYTVLLSKIAAIKCVCVKFDNSTLIQSRSKRLRKLILPIILLLKLKAAIIIPIVLSLISFLAFTGFKSGLAALAISGAVGLKSLLENHHGHPKIAYEILPSIASGWSRTSGDEGLPIAGYQTIP
ncbi:unnamed protein product [Psylliodes chrysocephalus]|uniref:Uncharacterized protein n=1 Tax=Psylliodes chrysocephalus TaxID=3402493 RepID=A0A9P0GJ55_9CUCU|nr:unnamed protein product [Psylliodes chrysocephala]